MTKNKTNPKVDGYFREATQWREVMGELRKILVGCGLNEDLKWSKPCYSFQNNNVVIMQPFKAYCALLFFKGVLLRDPKGILVKTGENTRVGRQIRFTNVREVVGRKAILKAYVDAAIEMEKAGVKVESETNVEIKNPEELKRKMAENPALKKAFEALTPGRQRGYVFYFSAAKQSKTRESRIDKYMQKILDGKGMLD